MILEILPERSGRAAENMAIDFLLLRHYPRPEVARFRHYDWHGPAFTFGYSQKIEGVRAQLQNAKGGDQVSQIGWEHDAHVEEQRLYKQDVEKAWNEAYDETAPR